MNVASTMAKMAALSHILKAANVLEMYGVLPEGIKPNDFVKKLVNANPDINELLTKGEVVK